MKVSMKSTIVTEKAAVEIKTSTGKKDHFNSLIIATLILKAETQYIWSYMVVNWLSMMHET